MKLLSITLPFIDNNGKENIFVGKDILHVQLISPCILLYIYNLVTETLNITDSLALGRKIDSGYLSGRVRGQLKVT